MDIKQLSIDEIGLSARARHGLHWANVENVEQLLTCTESMLQNIRNMGAKTVKEILEKIEEYRLLDAAGSKSSQELVTAYLASQKTKIDELELLSAHSYNLLLLADLEEIHRIAYWSVEQLMELPRMDQGSAEEIHVAVSRYLREHEEDILTQMQTVRKPKATESSDRSLAQLLSDPKLQEQIVSYVRNNDCIIQGTSLPNRAKNALARGGYERLSDIVFLLPEQLLKLENMGKGSVEAICTYRDAYWKEHEDRLCALISGDTSALWSDERIREMILNLYKESGFHGFSLNGMLEKLSLPEEVTKERVKGIIGQLIADGRIEYVDYRCYRVYPKFADTMRRCQRLDERARNVLQKRLEGLTLEVIGQEYNLSRERIRQISEKGYRQVVDDYRTRTGMALLDEDYYEYLYATYDFEKKDGSEWLGIPENIWNYLDMKGVKRGKKQLQEALEDIYNIDVGLRLKIKNYLNRNKLFIDGRWIEKTRSNLERVVVQKFCQEAVAFDDFVNIYNKFLEDQEIPYDENLYIGENAVHTRRNHLSGPANQYLFWTQNGMMRAYDIEGQDYDELLDTLNLDTYENIELSTMKFMEDYPEVMEKYDIRNQYELHNLLKKIIPDGSYHDFHSERMPHICFGTFNREEAIFDLLIEHAPISQVELCELVHREYGFDPLVVAMNYLKPFDMYLHRGQYILDEKVMPIEHRILLAEALTDNFYYLGEVRRIYSRLIPNADLEMINPYNLKNMGFTVLSKYVLQNYDSLDAYCEELLTANDITDITEYRRRFVNIQAAYAKLIELRRDLTVIEFAPNQLIHFRKLEKMGITKDMIQEYCDAVFDFVDENVYFSVTSIRQDGFNSDLFEWGFDDWFYGSLLLSDDRFSWGKMLGNNIFMKGKALLNIRDFETERINAFGSIDVFDLMTELVDHYGCSGGENRSKVLEKIKDTAIYYDEHLDRLYANEDMFYQELEVGGFKA